MRALKQVGLLAVLFMLLVSSNAQDTRGPIIWVTDTFISADCSTLTLEYSVHTNLIYANYVFIVYDGSNWLEAGEKTQLTNAQLERGKINTEVFPLPAGLGTIYSTEFRLQLNYAWDLYDSVYSHNSLYRLSCDPKDQRLNTGFGDLEVIAYVDETTDDDRTLVIYCYDGESAEIGLIVKESDVADLVSEGSHRLLAESVGCHADLYRLISGEYQLVITTSEGKIYHMISDDFGFANARKYAEQ